MTSQEGEALSLLAQQTGSQVTVTQTHLAVVGHRAGDAERLQTDTDGLGSVGGILHALLDGDGCTAYVGPFRILKADALGVLANLVGVHTGFLANGVGLFDGLDAVGIQSGDDLVDATLLTLEFHFSYHGFFLLYSLRGSIVFTTPCSAFVRP